MDHGRRTGRKSPYQGVRIRSHAGGVQTVQIAFSYGGRECRDTSPRPEPSAENLLWAHRVRQVILKEIELDTFDYARHFPQSPRAIQVGRTEGNRSSARFLMTISAKPRPCTPRRSMDTGR